MYSCTIKQLPPERMIEWAHDSHRINPFNRPAGNPQAIAALTTAYWGLGGVHLSVAFMEETTPTLQNKILSWMNEWSKRANIKFTLGSLSTADVRISRGPGGYYSYLGNQIRHVPKNEQTMNLQGFVLKTPDPEYARVIPHETFHTCGGVHEHMRRAEVARLDKAKTYAYFARTQGWTTQEVDQQVLKPMEEQTLMSTPPDETSIMCYQIPGECTIDGKPIIGGSVINESDFAFAARIYPLEIPTPPVNPPVNPPVQPPAPLTKTITVTGDNLKINGVMV